MVRSTSMRHNIYQKGGEVNSSFPVPPSPDDVINIEQTSFSSEPIVDEYF
jgi:hypothetical protein